MFYEIFWTCYWILVFLTIVISIIAIVKKHYITGIINLVLSIGMPIFSFIFAISRDFIGTEKPVSELEFLWNNLVAGNLDAFFIVIANVLIVCLTIYHIYKLVGKKK